MVADLHDPKFRRMLDEAYPPDPVPPAPARRNQGRTVDALTPEEIETLRRIVMPSHAERREMPRRLTLALWSTLLLLTAMGATALSACLIFLPRWEQCGAILALGGVWLLVFYGVLSWDERRGTKSESRKHD